MAEIVSIRLWQVRDTPKAYLFSTTPAASREGKQVWIPRSQIEHISRRPAEDPDGWPEVQVKMQLWIAEEKELV
jgi:hypothetical protein